jgi:hypothetical protein
LYNLIIYSSNESTPFFSTVSLPRTNQTTQNFRINMSGQGISHQGITAPGLSEADQNINNTTEDISNKASGHKANLSNPNTSEESKKKSAEALKALGGEDAFYGKQGKGE